MLSRIVLYLYQIYFKYAKKRYLKKRNFTYIESIFDEVPTTKQEMITFLDKFKQNDFDGFQSSFITLRQNDVILSGGQLKSSLFFESLVPIIYNYDTEEAHQCIVTLDEWWQKDKTAFASGLYSYVLYHRGWSKRGGGYINEVTEAGLQSYGEYLAKASKVLKDCDETTDTCLIWNLANYHLHSDGGITKQKLGEYFEKLIVLEPNNLNYYADHAFRVMPRWFGNSMQDVEDFARIAIERTKDHFGAGAYAMIYYTLSTVGDNPFEDSFCDLDLLDQGFEDLYKRFGGQACVNYHLMVLQWAMAHKRAYPLVENRLTTILSNIWIGDDDLNGAKLANVAIAMIGLKLFTFFENDEEENNNNNNLLNQRAASLPT